MGCVHNIERSFRSVAQPVEDIAADVGLTAIGQPELIPVANAAISAANGGGVKGALEAGGESLLGQEALGAVGIGDGNSFVNDALGINDTPIGTGLPDIGGSINSALGSVGGSGATDPATGLSVGQETTNAAGATINTATGDTVAPPQTPTVSGSPSGTIATASQSFDLGNSAVDAAAGGPSTSAPTGLGSISSSPTDAAIGSQSTDALGSIQPNTVNLDPNNTNATFGLSPTDNGATINAIGSQGAPNSTLGSISQSLGVSPAAGGVVNPGASANAAIGASGGGSSGGLLGEAESLGLKAAVPLAGLAYDAIKGPAKLPSASSAIAPNGAATAPLLGLENQGATEAQTGQLTPAQQATITQGVQQQQNLLLQQLASQGVTNPTKDSRYIAGMTQIQQWAAAQQQQYITAAISEATSAGGAASQNISTVANEQIQNDTAFQQSLAEAFGALGGSIGGVNPLSAVTKQAS